MIEASGNDPEAVLSAALAAISGCVEPPQQRSLLTGEEGLVTVLCTGQKLDQKGNVLWAVSRAIGDSSDAIGRISLLSSRKGAVFDAPEKVAKRLALLDSSAGVRFSLPKELPELEADYSPKRYQDNNGSGSRNFRSRDEGRRGNGDFYGKRSTTRDRR